jgi:lipid II:glycine glycyltransferase (peptidoglycan interpeptide bridge formation enzyme)
VSLEKKYKKAVPSLDDAKTTHEGLTETLQPDQIAKWTETYDKANKDREDALRIFDVVDKKSRTCSL